MKSNKNLVFLGMMGSGKSTIGSLVSKKLNLKFLDIDENIEKELNMKISEIFEKRGETFFRNLEEKITLRILSSKNSVISLGGGSFINDKIRKEVVTKNYSFWLSWNIVTLLNRIKNSKKRPIAYKLSEDSLKSLISKRSKIYAKAEFKINCDKLKKSEIVKKILQIYEDNQT